MSDFHFDLPAELIAQHPPAERGASRMLVVERQGTGNREQGNDAAWLRDAWFRELPEYLGAGDLLVLNDSRVLPARLFGVRAGLGTQANSPRPTGQIEVLLVEEVGEGTGNREQGTAAVWRALVKPAKKVRVGQRLEFYGLKPAATPGENNPLQGAGVAEPQLVAEVVDAGEFGERTLRFEAVEDFYGVVARIGHMPLPPYIARDQAEEPDSAEDRERYQTVYARQPGSAAAPTAGLHFTPEVLAELKGRGVEIAYLTLHVGLGTFQPVRVEEVEAIRLHTERYTLPADTAEALNRAMAEGRRVVAVGTTTTRTLEHIALRAESAPPGLKPVHTESLIRGAEAPRSLPFEPHSGETSIFIAPGHRFRVVSGMLTNFHLPESTLLMLVAAFKAPPGDPDAGRRAVLAAYDYAIRQGYRFYSYGDCMLLI